MQGLIESLAAPAISDFLLMPTLLQYSYQRPIWWGLVTYKIGQFYLLYFPLQIRVYSHILSRLTNLRLVSAHWNRLLTVLMPIVKSWVSIYIE